MEDSFPECFGTKENFETWVKQAEEDNSELPSPRFNFCRYCTPMWQECMKHLNKCSYPELDLELIKKEEEFEEWQESRASYQNEKNKNS